MNVQDSRLFSRAAFTVPSLPSAFYFLQRAPLRTWRPQGDHSRKARFSRRDAGTFPLPHQLRRAPPLRGGALGGAHHSLEEARPRGGRRTPLVSEDPRREAALKTAMAAPELGAVREGDCQK